MIADGPDWMEMTMKFSRNCAAAIVAAVLVGGLTVPTAAAADEPSDGAATSDDLGYPTEPYVDEFGIVFDPAYPFVDDTETNLLPADLSGPDGAISTYNITIQANPYGCRGLTEYVHQSGGFASLHARTHSCSAPVTEMTTSPSIVKLGLFGVWHSLGSNPATKSGVKVLDAYTKRYCSSYDSQTYRGNGYHRVLIGGKSYIAQTSSARSSTLACNAHAL